MADFVQVTIENGERCVCIEGITRATTCKELFSRLQLLTGSNIPKNAQMWANGRILRRHETIEEVQLNFVSYYSSHLFSSLAPFLVLLPWLLHICDTLLLSYKIIDHCSGWCYG